MRNNSSRDLFAEVLIEIWKDVVTEPPLLPLTGETLLAGFNLTDGAREDIRCSGESLKAGRPGQSYFTLFDNFDI